MSLIITEMKGKTTRRYHFIPVKITIIKKKKRERERDNKCSGKCAEKREFLYTLDGMEIGTVTKENSTVIKNRTTIWFSMCLLGNINKKK